MRPPILPALICLYLALPIPSFAKDHSYDIERARAAADNGEPERAKHILKDLLRKDPQDPALKTALEDLVHPPKTPTPTPTPRAEKPAAKPKAEPKPSAKAKPKVAAAKAPKAVKAAEPPKANTAPTPAAAVGASAESEARPSLFARLKAKLSGVFHRAPAPAPEAPAPLSSTAKTAAKPCQTVTYVHFGQTRSGRLLQDLPKTKELLVAYNKGKAKISRDQVVKTEDCAKR